jgi:hypothetical protein
VDLPGCTPSAPTSQASPRSDSCGPDETWVQNSRHGEKIHAIGTGREHRCSGWAGLHRPRSTACGLRKRVVNTDAGSEFIAPSSQHPSHISVSRFVSSLWSGASPVVCPCIAVMGLGPTACNRVGQTTGGAAHDERQGNRGSSMPSGARPGRQLEAAAQAAGSITSHLPPAAIAASHLWPVDTTAYSWRSIAAARAAWACPRLSLFSVRVVRWVNFAA